MRRKRSSEDLDDAESTRRETKLHRSSDDLPGPSSGLSSLANALSLSPSPSSSDTNHKATSRKREKSSKLVTLLDRLNSISTNQCLAHLELTPNSARRHDQATPNDSAQLEVEARRKPRKTVPRKRPASTTSQMSSAGFPLKKAKRSDSDCGIKKPASSLKSHRPRMTLIGQSQQSYKSLIANWKKQLSDWKAKNKEIDSKISHTMKYPSHLHEWMQRVKYNHTPKWEMYEYVKPKWTKWQLALTKTPGQCSPTV